MERMIHVALVPLMAMFVQEASAGTSKCDLHELESKLVTMANRYSMDSRAQASRGGSDSVDLSRTYAKTVGSLVDSKVNESDLADLAIWAERKDPWFYSQNYVYRFLFESNVSRLGKLSNQKAIQALARVKEAVVKDGRFDGHIAEVIEESEEAQKTKQSHN